MYRKHPNGTVEIVGDLEMNIPPVGTVFNVITGEWESRPVYSRSDKANEQFWERVEYPKDFRKRIRAEKEKREGNEKKKIPADPSFVDVELEDFRQREWDRRLNGFWFMNDGMPTYITGTHYYYLNYYYISSDTNEGFPEYWDSDRRWWHFYEYCAGDPKCWGFIYVVKRRSGKTQKSGSAMLEYVTSLPNKNGGIQSKTADDAKDVVYTASIVNAFKRLPPFFKPVYDTTGGTAPKKRLAFEISSDRSKHGSEVDYDDQLNSFIFYGNSKERALDGNKMHIYIGDEVFKSEGVDVRERHNVNKFCATDHNGNPLGLMLYTSTCEDIEGSIQTYVRMWKDSNQKTKDPKTGKTITGLYKLFIPSDELINHDKYGFCDKEANRELILADRVAVQDNRIELNSLVRKFPLTEEEAFRSAVRTCLFNSVKLTTRLDFLNFVPDDIPIYETGNFKWKNDVKFGEVIWVPDREGVFNIKAGCLLEPERANQVDKVGRYWIPKNGHKFLIGVDPYDHYTKEVSDQRQKSNGAFHLFCKFDIDHPEWEYTPLVDYCYRKDKPSDFYEDILLCAWYYSSPIFFESNKQGLRHYFENEKIEDSENDNKLSKFLLWLPNAKAPGIPSSDQTKQAMAEIVEEYVEKHTDKINFPELIDDLLNFEIENTRKYDRAMSFGWAVLGASRILLKPKSTGIQDMATLFKKHVIRSK